MLFIKKMFQRIFRRRLTTFFGLNTIKSKNLLRGDICNSNLKTPLITNSILGPISVKINKKVFDKYEATITLIYDEEYNFNTDIIEKNGILGFIYKDLFNPFYYEKRLIINDVLIESVIKNDVLEQTITFI